MIYNEFKLEIDKLSSWFYDRPYGETRGHMIYQKVKGYKLEHFAAAVDEIIMNEKWFPTIKIMLQYIKAEIGKDKSDNKLGCDKCKSDVAVLYGFHKEDLIWYGFRCDCAPDDFDKDERGKRVNKLIRWNDSYLDTYIIDVDAADEHHMKVWRARGGEEKMKNSPFQDEYNEFKKVFNQEKGCFNLTKEQLDKLADELERQENEERKPYAKL